MTETEEMKLMELLIKMGYSNDFIVLALMHAAAGMGIGPAMSAATIEIRNRDKRSNE